MEQNKASINILAKQNEYFQYLFEQEQRRAASIVAAVKVYIAFLVFILGSLFLKLAPINPVVEPPFNGSGPHWQMSIGISLMVLSSVTFSAALFFAILVLKVWSYHRLCDPLDRLKDTLRMTDQLEVLSKSLCDYAIATSRNHKINNKRARYLSKALGFLLSGAILLLLAVTMLAATS